MDHQLAPHATLKDLLRAGAALGLPRVVIPALVEAWGPEEAGRRFDRAAARLHDQDAPHRSRADRSRGRRTSWLARNAAGTGSVTNGGLITPTTKLSASMEAPRGGARGALWIS